MSELREALKKGKNQHRPHARGDGGVGETPTPYQWAPPARARGWLRTFAHTLYKMAMGTARTREGMGTVTNRYGILILYRPHARGDGVTFPSQTA